MRGPAGAGRELPDDAENEEDVSGRRREGDGGGGEGGAGGVVGPPLRRGSASPEARLGPGAVPDRPRHLHLGAVILSAGAGSSTRPGLDLQSRPGLPSLGAAAVPSLGSGPGSFLPLLAVSAGEGGLHSPFGGTTGRGFPAVREQVAGPGPPGVGSWHCPASPTPVPREVGAGQAPAPPEPKPGRPEVRPEVCPNDSGLFLLYKLRN